MSKELQAFDNLRFDLNLTMEEIKVCEDSDLNIIYEALKRNEPMKVKRIKNEYSECSNCNNKVIYLDKFCPKCGQNIDWGF